MTANRAGAKRRHQRTCAGKQSHPGRQQALDGLIALCRDKGAAMGGMQVYRCLACRRWHYGHRVGGKR